MGDGSSEQPRFTAGLDLGDKHSYLCLIDQQSGQMIEEGRLRTTEAAHHSRGLQAALCLRAAFAHSHRGRDPFALAFALGEQDARGMRSRSAGSQR